MKKRRFVYRKPGRGDRCVHRETKRSGTIAFVAEHPVGIGDSYYVRFDGAPDAVEGFDLAEIAIEKSSFVEVESREEQGQ